jgi:hypothetical protein
MLVRMWIERDLYNAVGEMEISVATMEIIMDIPPQTGNSANM